MIFWSRIIFIPFALALIFAVLELLLIALACSIVGLLLLLWKVPIFQIENMKIPEKERFQYEDRARKTLAQIMTGIVLIIGLYFVWQTYEISKKDRITESFSLAIDQLGASVLDRDSIGMLLGAIYTLEEIAMDHRTYHWKAMEVLSAYARQNAPRDDKEDMGAPAEDIKVILTVIGRRSWTEYEVWRINLADTNLQKVYLQRAHFEKVILDGANLAEANLRETHFDSASFRNTKLDGASMWKADLRGADFEGASLKNTNIREADLREAKNLTLRQIRSSCWSNITKFSEEIKIKLKSHRIKPQSDCPHKKVKIKKKSPVKKLKKQKTKRQKRKQKAIAKKVKMPEPVSKPIEGDIIIKPVEEKPKEKPKKEPGSKNYFFSDDDDLY